VGTKMNEMVSRTFLGARGHVNSGRPEMVEIDEENDILNSTETFERRAVHTKALKLLKIDLAGDEETRRMPVLVNDDVRIEMVTSRAPAEITHQRTDGWHEVHIQVEAQGTSRTAEGEFALQPSDLLVVPPGMSHESYADTPVTRLVVSTRRPLRVAPGYPVQEADTAPENGSEDGVIFLRPSVAADAIEEGIAGGKHFELVVNDDIMIETTFRADDQRIYHRGYDQDEVHFQLSGRRATRTSQGEFLLETGDALLIPPGLPHRNIGGMPTIRIVLYTKHPLSVPSEYETRLDQAWGA